MRAIGIAATYMFCILWLILSVVVLFIAAMLVRIVYAACLINVEYRHVVRRITAKRQNE